MEEEMKYLPRAGDAMAKRMLRLRSKIASSLSFREAWQTCKKTRSGRTGEMRKRQKTG